MAVFKNLTTLFPNRFPACLQTFPTIKETMLARILPLLAISASFLFTNPARAQDAKPNLDHAEKVFVGYVFRNPTKINFKLYTHLCQAFITANEDGIIRTNSNVPSGALVADAHQNNVKVLISLGGWGWDKQFAAITANPEAEQRYLRSVLELTDTYDYDGLDLDWEYPDNAKEIEGFNRICAHLRKELDAIGARKNRKMFFTMAAAASVTTLEWLPNDTLLKNLDWINVMTYDMAGEWTDYAGHHAPLFASKKQPGTPRSLELTISYLLKKGIPADRLALGLPLYGKGFAVTEPYASTKDKKGARPPGGNYNRLLQLQTERGWTRQLDEETKAPWLISPDATGVIGYDDAESLALKTEWAMKLNLRGVFFWEIAADRLPDGSNPLQEASHQKLIPK